MALRFTAQGRSGAGSWGSSQPVLQLTAAHLTAWGWMLEAFLSEWGLAGSLHLYSISLELNADAGQCGR